MSRLALPLSLAILSDIYALPGWQRQATDSFADAVGQC